MKPELYKLGELSSVGHYRPLSQRLLRTGLFILAVLAFTLLLMFFLLPFLKEFVKTSPQVAFYAYGMVFVVTFVSSALVFMPAPGSLFALSFSLTVADATGGRLWVILAASTGSTLGELSSYLVGRLGRKAIVDGAIFKLPSRAQRWMRRSAMLVVFVLALIPSFVFFDLAGITAGALRLPLWQFLGAVWAARLPRSTLEIYTGGEVFKFLNSLVR